MNPVALRTVLFALAVGGLLLTYGYARELEEASVPVTFVNVSREAGTAVPHVWGSRDSQRYIIEVKGSGLGFIDFDNDGWLDVYLSNGVRFDETYTSETAPISHLLKNNRDGTFTDVTARSGVGRTGWGTGVAVGDYDNDGWDDLFCTYWGHNVLLRNNGDGTFAHASKAAGLHGERVRWGSGSTFLDYDRDGDLDLFVANFIELDIEKLKTPLDPDPCLWKGLPIVCGPRGLPAGSNLFYRNDGDGTFTDVSEEAGVLAPGPHYSITPVSYDFDNDGWPDVYVAVDSMPSMLFHNNQDGTFSEIGVPAWVAYNEDGRPQAGMGLAIGDYDVDGWLDIFKTHFQDDTPVLYRGMGDGTFSDMTGPAGLGRLTQYVSWGAAFMDYDNDGWKDLFYVTGHVYQDPHADDFEAMYSPRVVLRNLGTGRFADVSAELGPGVSERFCSRGSAYGDYDNDGDVDMLVLNMNDPPSLLRNDGGNAQSWILVKLIGTTCNRSAIGARVRVVTGGHAQIDEVHSGGSVMSQSDLRLHFGLGSADVVDTIEVRWPTTQKVETFTQVQVNQILTIREGAGIVERRAGAASSRPTPAASD
jgi:hypothetical protein